MIENVNTDSITSIADYLEWYVLLNGPISKSKILRILDSSDDDAKERVIDSVFLEMSRRIKLYGECSHFTIKRNIIFSKGKWQDYPELMVCLIFSLEGVKRMKKKDDGTKLFERIWFHHLSFSFF